MQICVSVTSQQFHQNIKGSILCINEALLRTGVILLWVCLGLWQISRQRNVCFILEFHYNVVFKSLL